jgi:hypothetical protein
VTRKPGTPWVSIARSITPVRTALTITALRRVTQRFVSGGGKSVALDGVSPHSPCRLLTPFERDPRLRAELIAGSRSSLQAVSTATRTMSLPKLLPSSMPMKASGAVSRPSTMPSR